MNKSRRPPPTVKDRIVGTLVGTVAAALASIVVFTLHADPNIYPAIFVGWVGGMFVAWMVGREQSPPNSPD